MQSEKIYNLLCTLGNDRSVFYSSQTLKRRIDPEPTTDPAFTARNLSFGICATNHVERALLFAIMRPKTWAIDTSQNSSHKLTIRLHKRLLYTHETGYVYVVLRTSFEEIEPFVFYTKNSVHPLCALTIPPQDMLEYLCAHRVHTSYI